MCGLKKLSSVHKFCLINFEKPINQIIINELQSTCVVEIGLSEFHRMTVSVLKVHFRKLPPKIISYRDYKSFENERFMDSLILA